ncbi:MAG: hypothetical protein ACFCUE_02575 [Candidatus Bathyarchaeia archaeon]
MYSGIVLFCNKTTQQQCLSRKLYTCADEKTKPTSKILPGTVVFLYNTENKTLLGPFTALEEGGSALDAGAWAMDIDEHSFSENVQVTWEELHQIENAPDKLPFLNNPEKCSLTSLQTQRILELLREAKPYIKVKEEEKLT